MSWEIGQWVVDRKVEGDGAVGRIGKLREVEAVGRG